MSDEAKEMVDTIGSLPDVADMPLDLTKDEKLRSAALILAIRYHVDTIIKDARYLELMIQREEKAKFSNDPDKDLWHLKPSTVNGVLHIALEFEQFLIGNRSVVDRVTVDGEEVKPGRAQGDIT